MVVYDPEVMTRVRRAIAEVEREEYLNALVSFADIRKETEGRPFPTEGLSYFALCLALVEKQYRPAIEMAKKAIDSQFYKAEHYVNLGKIYVAAGNRKKAVDVVEKGLSVIPQDGRLRALRRELGVRQRPAVPFLDRANPINKSLGRTRRTKGSEENPEPQKESDE